MDRMTKARRVEGSQLGANWKEDTALAELHPLQRIEITRGHTRFYTTANELRQAGIPGFLSLAQVEWAFSTPDEPDEKIIPIWRKKMPNGRR